MLFRSDEIEGTRVNGDVELNCPYGRGVIINADRSVISYCTSAPQLPIVETQPITRNTPLDMSSPNYNPDYVLPVAVNNSYETATATATTSMTDTTTVTSANVDTVVNDTVTATTNVTNMYAEILALIAKIYALMALLGIK